MKRKKILQIKGWVDIMLKTRKAIKYGWALKKLQKSIGRSKVQPETVKDIVVSFMEVFVE